MSLLISTESLLSYISDKSLQESNLKSISFYMYQSITPIYGLNSIVYDRYMLSGIVIEVTISIGLTITGSELRSIQTGVSLLPEDIFHNSD